MLVHGKYECFVMQMLYVCVLCASCGSYQFCMTCSLLMLVEDAMSVSFCLPHHVAVSAFIICKLESTHPSMTDVKSIIFLMDSSQSYAETRTHN